MPVLQRVRVGWTGFPGAPGVNTFFAQDAALLTADLQAMFDQLKNLIPADVTIKVETTGDILDVLTGKITASWTAAALLPIVCLSAGAYSAPVGAQMQWLTGDIIRGRRLRGKTFIVPLGGASFATDGSLQTPESLQAQGTALIAAHAANLVVYSRPTPAYPAWTDRTGKLHNAVAARAGGFGTVTTCRVPDKAVVLRSRRD